MTNEQVVKRFLAQDSTKLIKSSSGNLSTKGIQLYSYDSILAEFSETLPILYIDKHIANYSNTSRKHARTLRIHNTHEYFSVSIGEPFEESLANMYADTQKLIGSYLRSRKFKSGIRAGIHERIKDAKLFAQTHNLNQELPAELFAELMIHKLL